MKKQVKKALFAVWGIILLTAVCMVPYAQEADTWIPVTRTNQIAGNWEGFFVFNTPADEEVMMPASSMDLTLSLWYAENADGIEMELKIDFSQFLTDWSPNIGLSPGELWELMDLNRDDDTFIQGVDYIVYYTQVFPAEETIAREDAMLINTDGTKLRFSESASTEIDGFDLSGFIMRRK